MDTGQKRWLGLTRVSTQGQADNGDGLLTQEGAIRAWVATHGGRLVDILSDTGVSGTLEQMHKRIALTEALRRLNEGRADGLIVARLDRLGRGTVQEVVINEVRRRGAEIVSCAPGEQKTIEGDDDPVQKLTRHVLGVFFDFERAMIVARTQAGRKRKMDAGGFVGGKPRYGYQLDGHGGLKEIPHEIAAIAQARTMREQFNAPLRVISEFLLASGMRLRGGHHLTPWQVSRILERAEQGDYPKPAPLTNLARLMMELPAIPEEV